jgi:hypothetical protein
MIAGDSGPAQYNHRYPTYSIEPSANRSFRQNAGTELDLFFQHSFAATTHSLLTTGQRNSTYDGVLSLPTEVY